jgi:hypothetical protein
MKTLLGAAPALILPLAILACGGDSDSAAGIDAAANARGAVIVDIRGEIKQIQTPGPDVTVGALLIEGVLETDTRYAKAWIRLKDTTVVQRLRAAETVAAAVGDLQSGIRVEVKFEGVVAELDPPQATAGEILILE